MGNHALFIKCAFVKRRCSDLKRVTRKSGGNFPSFPRANCFFLLKMFWCCLELYKTAIWGCLGSVFEYLWDRMSPWYHEAFGSQELSKSRDVVRLPPSILSESLLCAQHLKTVESVHLNFLQHNVMLSNVSLCPTRCPKSKKVNKNWNVLKQETYWLIIKIVANKFSSWWLISSSL